MCQDPKALGSPWCPEYGLYPIVRGPLTQEHVLRLQLPHSHPLQVKPQTTFSSLHVHTSQIVPCPQLCTIVPSGQSATVPPPSWSASLLLFTLQSPARGPPPLSSPVHSLLPQTELITPFVPPAPRTRPRLLTSPAVL